MSVQRQVQEGLTGKMKGRAGDTAIIGAGTYADNRTCAVSSTGNGEYFIRSALAKEISDYLLYHHPSPSATNTTTPPLSLISGPLSTVFNTSMTTLGPEGLGGVIVVTGKGEIGTKHNSNGMFRGWIQEDGVPHVAIFDEEEPIANLSTSVQ